MIKLLKMRFKIHMQPSSPTTSGKGDSLFHKPARHPLPAKRGKNASIQYERMDAAVPGNIDKADNGIAFICTHMTEAPFQYVGHGSQRLVAPSLPPQNGQRFKRWERINLVFQCGISGIRSTQGKNLYHDPRPSLHEQVTDIVALKLYTPTRSSNALPLAIRN
jgi:hypothetical protein